MYWYLGHVPVSSGHGTWINSFPPSLAQLWGWLYFTRPPLGLEAKEHDSTRDHLADLGGHRIANIKPWYNWSKEANICVHIAHTKTFACQASEFAKKTHSVRASLLELGLKAECPSWWVGYWIV